MPVVSGRELLEVARAQQLAVPLVIMTASILPTDDLMAAGASDCLFKPFDLDDLLACVTQHIRCRLEEPADEPRDYPG
jgi:DNA-binding response OmpR family regulator